ncbi:helix-turn-helix domain-containing protein [Nocardia sp. NPDC023852]|uniref:helix-turn-helix domain-containing protein n=1 Tax=Nocardia sp. NPDC023852 TaxID=3154697 RepID=UPI0033C2819E
MMARDYAVHQGHPDKGVGIVFAATTAVLIVVNLKGTACYPAEFVIRPRDSPVTLDSSFAASYLELWLDPLAAYRLRGTRDIKLNEPITDLGDALGPGGRELVGRIRDEPTWSGRFALLDNFLLNSFQSLPHVLPEIRRAWMLLTSSGGTAPISWIADEVGWSHKHLITKFTRQIGLTPKTAARIIRFDRARDLLVKQSRIPLHEIAAECGYADQSHLNRDFRKFSGVTPTGYIQRCRNRRAMPLAGVPVVTARKTTDMA